MADDNEKKKIKTMEGHQEVVLDGEVDSDFQLVPRITCERASELWKIFKETGIMRAEDGFRFIVHLGAEWEVHTDACVQDEGAEDTVRAYIWDPNTPLP